MSDNFRPIGARHGVTLVDHMVMIQTIERLVPPEKLAEELVRHHADYFNSMNASDVAKKTAKDAIAAHRRAIEIRGVKVPAFTFPAPPQCRVEKQPECEKQPEPEPEKQPEPEMAFDYDLSDLFQDMDDDRSPGLKEALQARVTKGLSDNPNKIKFFWEPFEYDGQMYWIFATWRLNAPGWTWNISGKMNQTIIHKGGPDLLVYDGSRAIKVSMDIEGEFSIPIRASAVYGRKMKAKATVFVWLLQFVEGRTLRFWVHEDMDNPKRSIDIGGTTLTMTLKKLAAPR